MGLVTGLMQFLFGDGRNVVAETAQVFRENAEAGAVRAADARADSLQQFAAEFAHPARGVFDRVVDGLNRLPRSALALGTIWLFVSAMRTPEEFASGMQVWPLSQSRFGGSWGQSSDFTLGPAIRLKRSNSKPPLRKHLAHIDKDPTKGRTTPHFRNGGEPDGQ